MLQGVDAIRTYYKKDVKIKVVMIVGALYYSLYKDALRNIKCKHFAL